MLVGPHLPPESVPLIRLAVERTSAEGEEIVAVLGLVRARTEVSALAVTTRRLLTLGRSAKDFPMHEEFFHPHVDSVQVERDSLLARGRVRVRLADQVHVLGFAVAGGGTIGPSPSWTGLWPRSGWVRTWPGRRCPARGCPPSPSRGPLGPLSR